MFDYCVILAGGSGTRLWPVSTSQRPKQFLAVPSKEGIRAAGKTESFLYAAIKRALAITDDSAGGRVIIAAGENHINLIAEECAGLKDKERKQIILIPEPHAKNTAAAIACALTYIAGVSEGRNQKVMVLSSDHIIRPTGIFKADANAAAVMAGADRLAVFGIPPLGPETGYGYIETGKALALPGGKGIHRKYRSEVFSVASFLEKPDIEKAKEFIAAKKFFWNSGMFAFSSNFMLDEFHHLSPEVIKPFGNLPVPGKHSFLLRKGLKILQHWDNLESAYRKTRAISFDCAIAEKCLASIMIKAGFLWSDVGSWDEYVRLTVNTGKEVYRAGEKTETCFVDSDIPVALCGTEDLIVVVKSGSDGKPAAVLISKKGETQHIKEIVKKIKSAGRTDLL